MGDNGEEPLQLPCLSINTRCSSLCGGEHSGGNVQIVRAFGWDCPACRGMQEHV